MEKLSKIKLKYLRSLRLKKNRDEEKCFVIEGQKMVLEALNLYPELVLEVFTTSPSDFESFTTPCFFLSQKDLQQISSLKTPNKCLALVRHIESKTLNNSFTLVLENVQDPGNMGTIIRMADWFGLTELICSQETVDCFNPKVIQASMGSIFRVEVKYTDLPSFFKSEKRPVYGALLNGENVYQQKLPQEAILVMGNEGKGLSVDLQACLTHHLTIPRIGQAESLNVSTATAILLSEFFRG